MEVAVAQACRAVGGLGEQLWSSTAVGEQMSGNQNHESLARHWRKIDGMERIVRMMRENEESTVRRRSRLRSYQGCALTN